MNNILKISMVAFSFIILTSCEKSNQERSEINGFEYNLSSFKKYFSYEYEKVSFDNLQTINSNSTKSSDVSSVDGITFPVMVDNKVIGRYIGLSDQSSAIYIDLSDYTNTITIYNVNDPNIFEEFEMVYNAEENIYEPITLKSATGFWCGVACGLGTVAIAASDGPAPMMDVLAASYAIACMAQCLEQEL